MFLTSARDKFTLLLQNSMTDVSVGFRPLYWCPTGWALYDVSVQIAIKLSKKVFPHVLHKKNCYDLNLGESLCTFTFFIFPDSGLYLLNGFEFYFDLF